MEKTELLDNLRTVCKDSHPSWGFLERICESIIEEFAKQNWSPCKISLTREEALMFDMDVFITLSSILKKIGITEFRLTYSSAGFLSLDSINP